MQMWAGRCGARLESGFAPLPVPCLPSVPRSLPHRALHVSHSRNLLTRERPPPRVRGASSVSSTTLSPEAPSATTPAPQSTGRQAYSGKHAVVVGAGPCGSLTAMYLARHGFTVDVFERTEVDRLDRGALSVGARSFNVMLYRRGETALVAGGVHLADGTHGKVDHVTRYRGEKVMFLNMDSGHYKSVNRGELSGYVYSEAIRQYPGRINFHFGLELQTASLDQRTAVFGSTEKLEGQAGRKEVLYDLLVGADGANSRVRDVMREQVPGFTYEQLKDFMEYKMCIVPPLTHADPRSDTGFFSMLDQERNVNLLGCAGADGDLRGSYILHEGEHAKLKTVDDYVAAMKLSFVTFTEEQLRSMASQLVNNPVSSGGLITRCSQLHGPSTILVGDAAHSMWPSLGQGANSALEDTVAVNSVLEECNGDLSAVPQRYSAVRLPDALAACELTQRGFGNTKARAAWINWFMVKVMIQAILNKVLPWLVPKPAQLTMNDTLDSYSKILRQIDLQSQMGDFLVIGLAAILIALAFKPWLSSAVTGALRLVGVGY